MGAIAALIGAVALASTDGAAFADSGHRIVGLVAEHHLQGSRALREVRRILRPGESLADAGVWPDTIKDPRYEDGDAAAFRLEHPGHDIYHYANLPLDSARYAPDVPGARPMDIVQTLREAIRVLRGASDLFTGREALRLLAHLAGDIHQPLHVGAAYVSAQDPPRFVTPRGPSGWRLTLGGNALVYGPQDRFNLHSYWDAHAVNLAMGRQSAEAFAAQLLKRIAAEADWKGRGDVESWPEAWASEAVALARTAHEGVTIESYVGADASGRTPHRWRITQPAGYDARARELVPRQLAKAGYRLAATLSAIWPER
jgi:hypothetical protein